MSQGLDQEVGFVCPMCADVWWAVMNVVQLVNNACRRHGVKDGVCIKFTGNLQLENNSK